MRTTKSCCNISNIRVTVCVLVAVLKASIASRTAKGDLRQIGRHGISGQKASVLARASFEVTVKHILEASVRGERDNLNGIAENVIVGQMIPLGTGTVSLLRTVS